MTFRLRSARRLGRWREEEEVDVLHESMRLAMDVIGRTMLGIPEIGEAGTIGEAIGTSLELASPPVVMSGVSTLRPAGPVRMRLDRRPVAEG